MPQLLERLKSALADRYTVESEIGRGGMAVVFLAEDLKHHRQVAIKVLSPDLSPGVGTERFLREIEIVASLTHPHILPLFDSGQTESLLFCVMPYIEGESLRERLKREKQLAVEDALQITREVAEALGYAHKNGIIHRDIKPGNILLKEGHAVVTDFGIARAVEQAGGAGITRTGLSVGTPAYMSPEQASGAQDVDGRADIYALGCVLYEMLSGETPYTGATPQAILAKKLSEPLPNVSVLRETVPVTVEEALTRALARVPVDRFATAGEFIAALERPAASQSVAKAFRPRTWPTFMRPIFAIALVAGAWGLWQLFAPGAGEESSPSIESLIVLPPSNASTDADRESLMAGLHGALITELHKLRAVAAISQTTARTYTGTAKSLSQIAIEVNVDGVVETSVFRQGDSLFIEARLFQGTPERLLWSGTFGGLPADRVTLPRRVVADLARALSIQMTSEEQELLSQSRPVDPDAWDLHQRGKFLLDQGTNEGTLAAEALAREAIAKDSTFAEAHALLADALIQISYWRDAPPMDLIQESQAAASRALELDSTLAVAAVRLADLSAANFQWNAAEEGFRRVLELNPGSAEAHIWYGAFLALLPGRGAEGVFHTAEGVRLDPVNLMARNVHAMALNVNGRYEDAAVQAREILKLNSTFPVAYGRLADALVRLGQKDSAVAVMRRGYALDPEPPLLKEWMAHIYALAGRAEPARALLDTLLILREQRWVAPSKIAIIYNDLGMADSAMSWLEQAYAVRDYDLAYFVSFVSPEVRSSPRFQALQRRMNLAP